MTVLKKIIHFIAFIWSISSISAQEMYPKNYFQSPLDIPLYLSGNFGELRDNHFHVGLDLKTQGKEGKKVYAIADGYISKIKIDLWGYGKVIYITHPNGYTSAYGHLQKFNPNLEKYVKRIQYDKEKYQIEIYLEPSQFPVKKGEIIAFSGNTGSSGGPHLHFEIRDSKNQDPLNPLLFGYKISDHIPPTVSRLIAYPLGEESQINGSQNPVEINITKQPDGAFFADKVEAFGKIGFGIEVIDKQDKSYNKNGAYSVEFSANGNVYSKCCFNRLSLSESRFLFTLIDYPLWKTHKNKVHLTYKTKGNGLSSIYSEVQNGGILKVNNGMYYNGNITAKDFEGNTTNIRIPIKGKELKITNPITPSQGKLIVAERDAIFNFKGGSVYFPKNTFFEDFLIQIERKNDTISIHNSSIPVRNYYNLDIEIPSDTTNLKRTFIAHINEHGKTRYQKTQLKDNYISTRTRELGNFLLMQDSIAPKVTPKLKNGDTLISPKKLVIKISDDLSGIKNYTPKLNGKWILMEYEPKKNQLTYNFSDFDKYPNKNTLELTVEDNVGNKTILEQSFFIKQTQK